MRRTGTFDEIRREVEEQQRVLRGKTLGIVFDEYVKENPGAARTVFEADLVDRFGDVVLALEVAAKLENDPSIDWRNRLQEIIGLVAKLAGRLS